MWIDCKPLFQSSGIVPFSQIFLKRSVRTLVKVLRSSFHFCMDGINASSFLHCMALMGSLTSTSVVGLVSMSRAISAGGSRQGHLVVTAGVWLSTS